MPLERPQLWTTWTASERAAKKELNQVLTRKWRNRYSAARVRPCVKPQFDAGRVTAPTASFTAITDPAPVYLWIPEGAQRLLAKVNLRVDWDGVGTVCDASWRLQLSGDWSTQIDISLDVDGDLFTDLYEGSTSGGDQTWYEKTFIIPDPDDPPFGPTEWQSSLHLLEFYAFCGSNCNWTEIKTAWRQWLWITEHYVPDMGPDWHLSNEYR